MSDPAATLASLLRSSTIQDHDEVLKLSNAAIKASKTDLDAHHTRVVALLKLDRFDDALRAIADGGHALEDICVLEKAYAQYKTGRLQEARETAEKAPSDQAASRSFRHLRAQIAYRAERFPDAAAIYRDLTSEAAGQYGDEGDIRINLLAANAQLEWTGLGYRIPDGERQSSRADLESFETAYNAACTHIARAELTKASVLLKRARDLCEASEDLSPEEKKIEILPMIVQHIYVLSQLGKDAEAAALQKLVVESEISEAPTRAIAQNNQIALAGADGNPYVTHRVAELAGKLSGNEKLFEYQQSIMRRNQYALDLQMQKFHGTDMSTNRRILDVSKPAELLDVAPLGVINAAARMQMGQGKADIRKILPVLEKRPNDIGLLLTIIQLYVQTQNPGPALTILETFLKRLETATTADYTDVRFSPGLVAAAVALYRHQGRQNSVRAELARASEHWRSKPEWPSTSLLQEAGVELLRSPNPEDIAAAGATFEKLVTQPGQDMIAAAGLVASFATRDFAKAEPYLQKLSPVEKLTAGINVQALVDAGVCSVVAPAPTTRKRAAANDPEKDKAPKRRRKKRLPKDYVEGQQPDPERWLPLRDRSTYRPKGKKGKKRAQEATQGGVVKEEETLELVGGAGAVKVEKAAGGGQGGKKKKKGKK